MLKLFIAKRKLVLLFVSMLILLGAITLYQLPKREVPEINPPVAVVTTIYPGAQAHQVERYVTDKIEEKLLTISEVEEITSVSSSDVSRIVIQLKDGADNNQVWNLVRQKLAEVESELPLNSESPQFNDDLSMQGISFYHFTIANPEAQVSLEQILPHWERQLRQVPGVAKVVFQGKGEQEVLVSLKPNHLRQHQLTWNQVLAAISTEVNTIPPGKWQMGQTNYRLQYSGSANAQELGKIRVSLGSSGSVIRLEDVAHVVETYQPQLEGVIYNGLTAITMTIFMEPATDILSLEKEINLLTTTLAAELPDGVELHKVYSQAGPVKQLFKELLIAFMIALVIVLIICSSGLSLPTALSVALAIPVSIALGSIVLPYLQVDMNQISLIAFIIVLGILVDDAIVVNENIQRNLRLGKDSLEAVVTGTREVAVSVVTSTVIVVFTFFPLLFLSGASGAFIKPLPAIIISTMLASTVVALILVPIYCYVLELRKNKLKPDSSIQATLVSQAGWLGNLLDHMANWYSEKVLGKVIMKPFLVAGLGFALSFSSFFLIPLIPLEFFPDTDREEVFVEMALPVGATYKIMEQEAILVNDWITSHDFVQDTSLFIGTQIPRLFGMNSNSGGGPHTANILVYVDKQQIKASQIAEHWNMQLEKNFPKMEFTVTYIQSGPPVGAPIALRLIGESSQVLQEMTGELKDILFQHPSVVNVNDDGGRPLLTLDFRPNTTATNYWGITSQQVSESLRLLGEGIPIGQLNSNGNLVSMRLVLDQNQTDHTNYRLEHSAIRAANNQWVPLSSLVTVDTIFTQQNIPRRNGVPTITVRAYPSIDSSVDEVLSEIRPLAEAMLAQRPGYQLEVAGETAARTDVFIEIGKIFMVVVVLVLLVMALQFYSITLPVLILSSVVLAVSGAIIGLFLTQTGLGFMSLLGVVSLAGIVVRNGIVMVEFIQANRQHFKLEKALQEAGRQRFRPIFLTTMTTILGLMPLVLSSNNLFKPLAIAIVAGMIFSASLSAVVVPALFLIWARTIGCQSYKLSDQTDSKASC